jgi:Phosphopantetheinyl transferase
MQVYLLDLTALRSDDVRCRALDALPAWRRQKVLSMSHPSAQEHRIGAGLLLSYGLRRAGVEPDTAVKTLPAGKPILVGRDNVWFSLSHSGLYALCAISDRPVGADIQEPRRTNLSIARRFCPDEQKFLSSLPESEREAAFFRLWTRKESWIKAASTDRMLALDEYSVLACAPPWRFRDYALSGGYTAAVCAVRDDFPQEPAFLSIEDVLQK